MPNTPCAETILILTNLILPIAGVNLGESRLQPSAFASK